MNEILKIINKYKDQLNNEIGLNARMYFHENNRLNIDDSVFYFFKEKINSISLDWYNQELPLKTENLFLGIYYDDVVYRHFAAFGEEGLFLLSYEHRNESDVSNKYPGINSLTIIYWDDVESVNLEYGRDENHRMNFKIKENKGNNSFYSILITEGFLWRGLGASNYQTCKLLTQLFNEIIETANNLPELDDATEELFQLLEDEKYNEILENVELLNDDPENVYTYHFFRMKVFQRKGENLKALNEVDDYRRFLDRNDKEHNFLLSMLYCNVYLHNEDSLNSIKWLNRSLQLYPKINKKDDVDFFESIQLELEDSYENLKNEFLDIPFPKRKFILMSDQILHCELEGLVVLKANDPPESVKFPLSHPLLNEVYTCHPINNSSYIPLKDYQKELFIDKLREFLLLLDVLGATKIDVINKSKNIDNNQNSSGENIGVGAGYKGVTANVQYKKGKSSENQLEKELNLAFHQRLNPKKAPYLPDGLVWFHTDLNWQRMAEQRMNGSLMSHKEIFSSKQIESLSYNELTKVNVELNILFAKANVDYQKNDFGESSSEQHFELEIQVEFEDLDNLNQVHSNSEKIFLEKNKSSINNSNIDKYKHDVEFMLEDDGVIDEVERKLLNRKIEKYGLTKDEAEQVENELMFNSDEVKYIEEYKIMLEEGEIGEVEQKMLDRYAQRYNINKTRQQVLEQSIKIK